jgi:hypothetical protein
MKMGLPYSFPENADYDPVSSEDALLENKEKDFTEPVIGKRSSTPWTAVHITLIFTYTVIFGLSFFRLNQSFSCGTDLIFCKYLVLLTHFLRLIMVQLPPGRPLCLQQSSMMRP